MHTLIINLSIGPPYTKHVSTTWHCVYLWVYHSIMCAQTPMIIDLDIEYGILCGGIPGTISIGLGRDLLFSHGPFAINPYTIYFGTNHLLQTNYCFNHLNSEKSENNDENDENDQKNDENNTNNNKIKTRNVEILDWFWQCCLHIKLVYKKLINTNQFLKESGLILILPSNIPNTILLNLYELFNINFRIETDKLPPFSLNILDDVSYMRSPVRSLGLKNDFMNIKLINLNNNNIKKFDNLLITSIMNRLKFEGKFYQLIELMYLLPLYENFYDICNNNKNNDKNNNNNINNNNKNKNNIDNIVIINHDPYLHENNTLKELIFLYQQRLIDDYFHSSKIIPQNIIEEEKIMDKDDDFDIDEIENSVISTPVILEIPIRLLRFLQIVLPYRKKRTKSSRSKRSRGKKRNKKNKNNDNNDNDNNNNNYDNNIDKNNNNNNNKSIEFEEKITPQLPNYIKDIESENLFGHYCREFDPLGKLEPSPPLFNKLEKGDILSVCLFSHSKLIHKNYDWCWNEIPSSSGFLYVLDIIEKESNYMIELNQKINDKNNNNNNNNNNGNNENDNDKKNTEPYVVLLSPFPGIIPSPILLRGIVKKYALPDDDIINSLLRYEIEEI